MLHLQQLAKQWRHLASESRAEATRIRRTIKGDKTSAEDRCETRAEVWDRCAAELEDKLKLNP
jgi:hypothetical protein